MKFVKLMSLILLVIICGTSGAFAQNSSLTHQIYESWTIDPKLEKMFEGYETSWTINPELEARLQPYETSWTVIDPRFEGYKYNLIDNNSTVEDAYVAVFGNFGGKEILYPPYDVDLPDEMRGIPIVCHVSFWVNLNEGYSPNLGPFFTEIHTCPSDIIESYEVFSLFHPISHSQNGVGYFVIPLKDIGLSQDVLEDAILMEQAELISSIESDEYMTPREIKTLIKKSIKLTIER